MLAKSGFSVCCFLGSVEQVKDGVRLSSEGSAM
jgi:hypothetical protein